MIMIAALTAWAAARGEEPAPEGEAEFRALKQEAARYDRDEAWEPALRTYLDIADRYRGTDRARFAMGQIELLAAMFLGGEARLSDEAFAAMEPVLVRAAEHEIFPATMLLADRLRAAGRSEEAFRYFQDAATKGYPPAMVQVGLMYSNGDGVPRDMQKASAWLRPANVKGSAVGKYLLAECFLFGKGVPRNPEAAVMLLRDAVTMEHPGRAMDLLATCYHKGWGVEADPAEAVRLYRSACDQGFYNACANLGVLYMKGEGVERSPTKALRLFRDGVEAGNGLCMYFYAAAHLDGLGLEQDGATARHWFRRAAAAGNAQALAWCQAHGEDLTVLER